MNWSLQGHPVDGRYEILYADPPWAYKDKNIPSGAEKQYPTMSLDQMSEIPISRLAAPNAVLFMWATWPLLTDALELIRDWGFEYKNCGFLWAKLNKVQRTPFLGLGHWTRGNTEPCLFATRGKPHRIDAGVEQLVLDPIQRHSQKPAEVGNRILDLMGNLPAVELFAREQVKNWDGFGNELPPETSIQLHP